MTGGTPVAGLFFLRRFSLEKSSCRHVNNLDVVSVVYHTSLLVLDSSRPLTTTAILLDPPSARVAAIVGAGDKITTAWTSVVVAPLAELSANRLAA